MAVDDLRYLGFRALSLRPGETVELDTTGRETGVLTISGSGTAAADGDKFPLRRRDVFEELSGLLYVPPGTALTLTATTEWTVAVGTAPASGRYPVRLIAPEEMKVEQRGGGVAIRQIHHVLTHPLPAERLVVYEALVPAGAWAGWPPHCHDGRHGSPNFEETYFFRFDRAEGFGFHRNYVEDGSFDETFVVRDGDCVAVPRGFHVTAPSPAANMWILNFLAGEPVDEERARPPYFDPTTSWITDDWSRGRLELPVAVR
ncbi:5-deoxy-glucuronate isomerase [Amycolatopsis sp. K13G38]|uniref:5-deoxy-glucuronate isomerase n=1 Tax=Amycolatopsis acididurans TaxID=2724524 RepID=A0ABX1J9Q0_9PSEU|nr:5-deoxy-glucuronate isomerase [Amycolatopsis acididurans]NKQ55027.1 5-deoxy-glucuronate isomerase [Amycolatopsis acididurans]